MKPRYEILLFDADNTLFDFYSSEKNALEEALRMHGLPTDREIITTYSSINDALWKALERGEVDKIRLRTLRFEQLCDRFGFVCDRVSLADSYSDCLSRQCILMPSAYDVTQTLSTRYRMYIITNGIGTVQRRRFLQAPIAPFFKDLFISEDLGQEKPARAFFDAVASRIPDFDRKKALVIGDSLTSDIRGGANAGIDTCWLNPSGKENPYRDLPITYTVGALEDLYDIL